MAKPSIEFLGGFFELSFPVSILATLELLVGFGSL